MARARIIAAARELFFRGGFVRVTADEIAAELGISKATLYKEFRSKEEVLLVVVREFMADVAGRVDILMNDESLSFVDRLAALSSLVGSRISELGPLFIRDIQKSAPAVLKEI